MVQTDLIVYEGKMNRFAAILWISICLSSPVESFAPLISPHRSELKACPSQRKRQVVTNRDFNVQLSQSVPDDMIGEEKVNGQHSFTLKRCNLCCYTRPLFINGRCHRLQLSHNSQC